MSEAKFTEGEWVVDDSYSTMFNVKVVHDKHNETGVCEVCCSWVLDEHNECQNDPTEEESANAHLMAAAPEMYQVLNELSNFNCPDEYMTESELSAFDKIETLLSKSRGEL